MNPSLPEQRTLLEYQASMIGASEVVDLQTSRRDSRADEAWARGATSYHQHLRSEGIIGEEWARRIRWHVHRTPELLRRVGVERIPQPAELTVEHLHALRDRLGWSRNGLGVYYSALRGYLRAISQPLAEARGAWRLPSGDATRRRWILPEQLQALLDAAQGNERVVVALEGYNALRRVEVKRLKIGDLDLEAGRIRVCGKGRGGGKWRTIPLTAVSARVLGPIVKGRQPEAPLLGRSNSGLDALLARAVRRAGLEVKVSNHDLRRTFGRVAYQSGMGLVDLKNFMGHTSVDMTAHYIGLDEDHMREGLARFNARMEDPTPRGRTRGNRHPSSRRTL